MNRHAEHDDYFERNGYAVAIIPSAVTVPPPGFRNRNRKAGSGLSLEFRRRYADSSFHQSTTEPSSGS